MIAFLNLCILASATNLFSPKAVVKGLTRHGSSGSGIGHNKLFTAGGQDGQGLRYAGAWLSSREMLEKWGERVSVAELRTRNLEAGSFEFFPPEHWFGKQTVDVLDFAVLQ
jgi:hypothetical protein